MSEEAPTSIAPVRPAPCFPPPSAVKAPVVNVRNLSSPFWRTAMPQSGSRCLVPATSFSEWSARAPGTGKCTLHWFEVPSRPVFTLAGIWRPTAEGAAYAFLTTEPNAIVGEIHPRAMRLILTEEDHDQWLGGDFDAAFAQPFPSQLMTTMTE